MGDDYEQDRLYARRQARRMPWQIAGIVAFLAAVGAATASLWIVSGLLAFAGTTILLLALAQ